MGSTMTKRERVLAAVKGHEVDRVPVGFWAHNFARENSARALATETVRVAGKYDWDYLKVQSRASYFAEGWGNRYSRSTRSSVPPTLVSHGLFSVADLARLQPLPLNHPVLLEQQEALRQVRDLVGPDIPVVWTIFCPLTIAASLIPEGNEGIKAAMRSDPGVLLAGLESITRTYAGLSRRYFDLGADGIFYASKWVGPRMLSREEHRKFARPFDLRILHAVQSAPFNILHLCGEDLYFADFHDYPAAAVNWAVGNGNPSFSEAREMTDRPLLGGVSPKPDFAGLTPGQVKRQVADAIEATGGRRCLIGPGCSVNPSSPPENYRAARDAVTAAIIRS